MFLDINNNPDQIYAAEFYQNQTKEEVQWRRRGFLASGVFV